METLLWYDYETTGIDPKSDRIAQFAAIRTDLDLNVIGEPINLFCRPSLDLLPNPEAALVTAITPQQARQKGLPEYQFIAAIQHHFMQPQTCGVGYNSIRFDDEFSRYTLYRNFYDAYQREWKNGNSRWDIIDMTRLVYALRPDTLEWQPSSAENEPFAPSFKLEKLSVANHLEHQQAHDALSDVVATIELAKLIKQRQPKLYDYCWKLRRKQQAFELMDIRNPKPLLHISSKYSSKQACASVVLPLMQHPTNSNGVVVLDLSKPYEDLSSLNEASIEQRLYTSNEQLDNLGLKRFPIKTIHANRSPIIATTKLIDQGAQQRMQLTADSWMQNHRDWIDSNQLGLLKTLLTNILAKPFETTNVDPEHSLYDGFLSNNDRSLCQQIIRASTDGGSKLAEQNYVFDNPKMDELLWRYRARNFPETLSAEQHQQWQQFRQQRLIDPSYGCSIVMDDYIKRIEELRKNASEQQLQILDDLLNWGHELVK